MTEIQITELADLLEGDVITALDGKPYRKPLTVTAELGPIEPKSPVWGVRLEPAGGDVIEWVFYPGPMDGRTLTVTR